jgi:hypothetical protein
MISRLDAIPIIGLLPLVVLLALLLIEVGRWFGVRRKGTEHDGTVVASVGATLGLLAFMLAFTFGMAASRFDTRREMALEDANSIGTTYLRAQLLPEPASSQIRALLREYVDLRLEAAANPGSVASAKERSEQIQGQVWAATTALVARQQPTLGATVPFITALNDMIDVHGKRVSAIRNRIPGAIWFFLFLTAAIGMLSVGYQAGLTTSRRSTAVVALAVAFSGVIMLIADLDRPQEGLVVVSQQPMIDLQTSMQADVKNPVPSSVPAP